MILLMNYVVFTTRLRIIWPPDSSSMGWEGRMTSLHQRLANVALRFLNAFSPLQMPTLVKCNTYAIGQDDKKTRPDVR